MFERIGKNIKILRNKNKITQINLANRLNISRQQVANYESGKVTIPLSNIVEMSSIFNISIDHLVKEDFSLKNELLETKKIQTNTLDLTNTDSITIYLNKTIQERVQPLEEKLNTLLMKLEMNELKQELGEELAKVEKRIIKENKISNI